MSPPQKPIAETDCPPFRAFLDEPQMCEQRRRLCLALRLCLFALVALATRAQAQRPLNLGFERLTTQGTGRPWGWTPLFGVGDVSMDSTVLRSGRYSLHVSRAASASDGGAEDWGVLRLFVPPLAAQHKRLQLSAWVRSDGTAKPRIAVEAWALGRILTGDSATVATTADSKWVQQTLSVSVDTAAFAVVITVGIQGRGTVWFDDLSVQIDGRRYDAVPVSPEATKGDVGWLDARTATLATTDPVTDATHDDADLAAVDRIIGSARIIALGEDTHGTSEFFRLKDRVLRYLVGQRGVRIFAIEANQMAVEGINRYVHGASGDARDVMRAMFQVWNTLEMEALIEWMRARNAQHPTDQVSFVGYDMQDPTLPIDSVHAFLDRRQPDQTSAVLALYSNYREAWRRGPYPFAPDSVRTGWQQSADSAWRIVTNRAPAWRASARTRTDSIQVDWVVQNANVVRQAAFAAMTGTPADRDSSMAENIRWLLDRAPSGSNVVVWAHNAHVGRGSNPATGFFGGRSMGTYLSRLLGDDYRVLGLTSYDGQYRGTLSGRDRRLVNADAVPAPVGTLEEVLHRIAQRRNAGVLATDLRDAKQLPPTTWVRVPHPTRLTGYAVVDFDWEQVVAVPEVFDALLFVDHATASKTIERR
jgi:erythromycin esterase